MENRLNVLCKIPGIGKKTAERLIIEIRDKLDGLFVTVSSLHPKISAASQTVQDAMSALIQLGYHQNIAQKAVKKSLETLPENPEIALLITQALKNV